MSILEEPMWDDAEQNQLSSSQESDYTDHQKPLRRKRRKVTLVSGGRALRSNQVKREASEHPQESREEFSFDSLLDLLPETGEVYPFEDFIETILPELIDASASAQVERLKYDASGQQVIPMSRMQTRQMLDELPPYATQNPLQAILRRRLMTERGNLRSMILGVVNKNPMNIHDRPVTSLSHPQPASVNAEVINGLYSIGTTPYDFSFLSRLRGAQPAQIRGCLAVDWEIRTPWMDLMQDIRDHFSLMNPDREQPSEVEAPIEYVTLQACHLPQVHAMLQRAFWDGIDVSDTLQYSPEQCTIIAMYKKMVVGVALLSSPQETYITYLAVKLGWDNAQIATSMLYHLITLNPQKDIILHVSINNPAVLLYNRFGFKAEEFIVGFYEDYLDSKSRASKNAFRLRLRR